MNPDTDDSFGGGGDGGPSGSSSFPAAQSQGTTSVEDDFADALADIEGSAAAAAAAAAPLEPTPFSGYPIAPASR